MLPYSFLLFLNYQSNSHSLYPFMYLSLPFFFGLSSLYSFTKFPALFIFLSLFSSPFNSLFLCGKMTISKNSNHSGFFLLLWAFTMNFFIFQPRNGMKDIYIFFMCVYAFNVMDQPIFLSFLLFSFSPL